MPLFKKAALDLPRASLPYVDRLFVQLHVVASFLNLTFAPYKFPAAASVLGGLVRHSWGNSNLIHLRYQCHSKWYYTNIFPGLQGFSKKYCSFFDTSSGRLLGAAGALGESALWGSWVKVQRFLHFAPMRGGQRAGLCTHCVCKLPGIGTMGQNIAFAPYAGDQPGRSAHVLRVHAPWHWNYGTKYCICPLRRRPTG